MSQTPSQVAATPGRAESSGVVTREQQYARRAAERVADVDEAIFDKYLTFARKLPALIHKNGLIQSLAFAAKSKGEDDDAEPNRRVAEDLAVVLGRQDLGSLVSKCYQSTLAEHLRLAAESLRAAGWLKRQAEGRDALRAVRRQGAPEQQATAPPTGVPT